VADEGSDLRQQVEDYRRIVLQYEALDEEIDALLASHGGDAEAMSLEELERYRALARQRDDLFNDIRMLEQTLLHDESGE
jgi:hypothetical protein